MRFIAATAIFFFLGTTALAAPTPQDDDPQSEDVSITDFYAHKAGANGTTAGTVDSVSFKLSGENATDLSCSASTGIPSDVITCSETVYRFALYPGNSTANFVLRIYHELGVAVGFYGAGDIPTYCHSGGLDTMVCSQVKTPIVIHIDSV
ncbi:hypothetical protein F4779DRAFT_515624 [Xylariaceae sp. FL0662B]|nr:hypothetical protein F4779DRAFT_515624 [Xylariaceae sp. FL0662B]